MSLPNLLLKIQKSKKDKKIIKDKDIPKNLYNEYTLNNKIPVIKKILNGKNDLHRKNWTTEYLKSYIERFTIENILNNKHGHEPYKKGAHIICEALKSYDFKNKTVAIVGSTSPWVEAIVINHGCEDITTVEYNRPISSHPFIKTIEYNDFVKEEKKYDFIITYSSIEHSGLGRYGDPLNPNADLETMDVIHKSLNDDGVLFWGAPVGGRDVLTWNCHRVYGEIRLPLIFKNFKIIKWYGLNESVLKIKKIYQTGLGQPVITAKKL